MNDPRPIGPIERAGPLDDTPMPLKLRLEDFVTLDAAGAFRDYARTELIDGEIIYMNAQHRPHARAKTEIGYLLREALRDREDGLTMMIEVSLAVPPKDAPDPDIILTTAPDGDGLVPVGSVALVIEVADASLSFDLGRKRERYAVARVPEYWVADVNGRVIHQFWQPAGADYAERRAVSFGERIAAATIDGLTIPTDRLG